MQDEDKPSYVLVPWSELSDAALSGLVDTYINRDGTDYGAVELSLEEKRLQALKALKNGSVSIVYDAASESVTLLDSESLQSM